MAKKVKKSSPKNNKKVTIYLLAAAIAINAISAVMSPDPLWPVIALALTAAALVYIHKDK